MKEIKFKGYSRAINKFVYGCLVKTWSKDKEDFLDDRLMIVSKNNNIYYEIDKDSICQYTGFKDEKRIEIYEGDIIEIERNNKPNDKARVCFDNALGMWMAYTEIGFIQLSLINGTGKVIGNIYEEKLKED